MTHRVSTSAVFIQWCIFGGGWTRQHDARAKSVDLAGAVNPSKQKSGGVDESLSLIRLSSITDVSKRYHFIPIWIAKWTGAESKLFINFSPVLGSDSEAGIPALFKSRSSFVRSVYKSRTSVSFFFASWTVKDPMHRSQIMRSCKKRSSHPNPESPARLSVRVDQHRSRQSKPWRLRKTRFELQHPPAWVVPEWWLRYQWPTLSERQSEWLGLFAEMIEFVKVRWCDRGKEISDLS